MKGNDLNIILDKMSDEVNLSVFTDMHIDSPDCDMKRLDKDLRARSKLPNAIFISLGDAFNSILPGDVKRFIPSEQLAGLADKDDMIDAMVEHGANKISQYPWIMLGQGNHELTTLQKHMTDVTKRLALKCKLPEYVESPDGKTIPPHGSYSGFLRLGLWERSRRQNKLISSPRGRLLIAYTHGGWVGQNSLQRASQWAGTMQGARLFLYGHNHVTESKVITWFRYNDKGEVKCEDGVVAACGTYMKAYSEVKTTHIERKMVRPSHLGAPLFKIRLVKESSNETRVKIQHVTEV